MKKSLFLLCGLFFCAHSISAMERKKENKAKEKTENNLCVTSLTKEIQRSMNFAATIELDLSNGNFSEKILDLACLIHTFPNIQKINLSYNNIHTVPLKKLSDVNYRLTHLNLSYNKLKTFDIGKLLEKFTGLEHVDLQSNTELEKSNSDNLLTAILSLISKKQG